jgi:hypothetical protein
MTTEPDWSDELRRRSSPARLQPMPHEKVGELLSLEWGSGEFDARVYRALKVRCIGDCPGHVGYVRVVMETPRAGASPHLIASSTKEAACKEAWIARQDECWREKFQITGRKTVATTIPGGGQRWAKFVPLEGWKIERGLWKLTTRARKQQQLGYPHQRSPSRRTIQAYE